MVGAASVHGWKRSPYSGNSLGAGVYSPRHVPLLQARKRRLLWYLGPPEPARAGWLWSSLSASMVKSSVPTLSRSNLRLFNYYFFILILNGESLSNYEVGRALFYWLDNVWDENEESTKKKKCQLLSFFFFFGFMF